MNASELKWKDWCGIFLILVAIASVSAPAYIFSQAVWVRVLGTATVPFILTALLAYSSARDVKYSAKFVDISQRSGEDQWCKFIYQAITEKIQITWKLKKQAGFKTSVPWDEDHTECVKAAERGNKRAQAMLSDFALWRVTK